jgi:hypothetical protein
LDVDAGCLALHLDGVELVGRALKPNAH